MGLTCCKSKPEEEETPLLHQKKHHFISGPVPVCQKCGNKADAAAGDCKYYDPKELSVKDVVNKLTSSWVLIAFVGAMIFSIGSLYLSFKSLDKQLQKAQSQLNALPVGADMTKAFIQCNDYLKLFSEVNNTYNSVSPSVNAALADCKQFLALNEDLSTKIDQRLKELGIPDDLKSIRADVSTRLRGCQIYIQSGGASCEVGAIGSPSAEMGTGFHCTGYLWTGDFGQVPSARRMCLQVCIACN